MTMKNGWIKFFADGTTEIGSDEMIAHKMASWSRGRLDGITRLEVWHKDHLVLSLEGQGDFWQSDDYESHFMTGQTKRYVRRIQYKIKRHTTNQLNLRYKNYPGIHVIMDEDKNVDNNELTGQWLVLEYNIQTNQATSYVSEHYI